MFPIVEKNWIHPALLELRWEPIIDIGILAAQRALIQYFHNIPEITDTRSGFHTLMILFKKNQQLHERLKWEEVLNHLSLPIGAIQSKEWKIPVCYELGKELTQFAELKGLSVEAVIELHSKDSYRLHFYGFLPGFMYLGGLDDKLVADRKSSPDPLVEAGSVAIGGAQTGIYTLPSPGGWYIIGKTPIHLFDIQKSPPVEAAVGDTIRFVPIDRDTYEYLKQPVHSRPQEWKYE